MKTALITGASGGIGSKTVMKFLSEGFFVAALFNKGEDNIKKLVSEAEINGFGGYLAPYKCDLKNPSEINTVAEKILSDFGHIDVLINNAGVDLYKLITETTEKEWDDLFSVNVKSVFLLTNLVLPEMIKRKKGKIVNVSSVWGKIGASMEVAYSASKAAIIGYTKALAKEVSLSGINVNCVCPGIIDTAMNKRLTDEEMKEALSSVPIPRIGDPYEVAEAIYFLCGDHSDYITGEIISVDGGFSL